MWACLFGVRVKPKGARPRSVSAAAGTQTGMLSHPDTPAEGHVFACSTVVPAPWFWSRAISVTEGTWACMLGQLVATPWLAVAPGWPQCGLEDSSVGPGSRSHSSSSSLLGLGESLTQELSAPCPFAPPPGIRLQHEPAGAATPPALEPGEQTGASGWDQLPGERWAP